MVQGSRNQLYIAAALICGGVLAFFTVLAVMGIDPDKQSLGLAYWMLGGVLIAPGFGYLIKWRRARDAARPGRAAGPVP